MKQLLVIALCACFCSPCFAGEYLEVTGGHTVSIPGDLYYRKDYRVQWWYYTGHLFDRGGREFGYELTFFVVNVQRRHYESRFGVNRIYISHFAVSDVADAKFYFSDKSDSGAYGFAGAADNRLTAWVEDNIVEGSATKMHLKASDGKVGVDLKLTPARPFILNGDEGFSRKSEESPLSASYYFSCPLLDTRGALKIGDEVIEVEGKSWFDREISTRGLGEEKAGWDWFALQLDDGREIMLYLLRNKDGSLDRYSSGTFVNVDGTYRSLPLNEFSVKVLDRYRSAKTGARYPSKWEIRIPSEKVALTISPLIEDQEVISYNTTGNYYWEGTCRVEGSSKGRAYVEMTGY